MLARDFAEILTRLCWRYGARMAVCDRDVAVLMMRSRRASSIGVNSIKLHLIKLSPPAWFVQCQMTASMFRQGLYCIYGMPLPLLNGKETLRAEMGGIDASIIRVIPSEA